MQRYRQIDYFVEMTRKGRAMIDDERNPSQCCAVFGVEHGGPIIGLGILIILFGLVPFRIVKNLWPVPVALLFVGFGIFLIWAGLTK
jgi:hypothetical protein